MYFNRIFSQTKYLENALDASSLRNQVIQNNIANAETPNFKASSVDFESTFQRALLNQGGFQNKQTREKHIAFDTSIDNVKGTVYQHNNTTMKMDGNNVDIDYENAQLAKNQIYYSTLVQKLNSEFSRLRMAIREGS
ncbi:flagellar basal body rod protein FlgB [Eubacteriales bacterium OttesenSCG-928-M02]|nr:flagellar basal body rod protein FlgB [Eubacteriales bacterium OttesenSCG-928-M02]